MKKSAVSIAAASVMTLAAALPEKPFFQLLDTACQASPGENVLISPFGIRQCFGMLVPGAGELSGGELKSVLALDPSSVTGISQASASLRRSEKEFLCFNTLTVDRRHTPKRDFVDQVSGLFSARFFRADFSRPAECADLLNKMIREQSRGMLDKVFDERELADAVAVLLNVLYFKDAWEIPFDPVMTEDAPFHLPGGRSCRAEMMARKFFVPYYNDGEIHGITLAYKNRRFRMTFLMPVSEKTSLSAVIGKLADHGMNGLREKFSGEYKTDVRLPKLDLSADTDLKQLLRGAGVRILFDAQKGDLTGIVEGRRLYIGRARQLIKLKMDENGTEMAAATYAVAFVTSALPRPEKVNVFHADRPFVLVLWDSETGAVLLAGAINRP